MASASLFWRVGGGIALSLWGPRSNLWSSTWNHSLITGIYPAAVARRPVSIFLQTKNNIYTPGARC